ncbi:MAG: methyltransferase domain-containing protein, partial [Verrucomicrobiota bacterium]
MKIIEPTRSGNPDLYNIHEHQALRSGARQSAERIIPILRKWITPNSVLDFGCGNGAWLSAFREAGVSEIFGLDGGYVEETDFLIPPECFRSHDLTHPIDLDRRFDLVMSLEVAEHLPPESAADFVHCLTRHGEIILFSAAIPDQGGLNHLNERWQSYWVKLFQEQGYQVLDPLRPVIWNDRKIRIWYRQNTLLFASPGALLRNSFLQTAAERTDRGRIDCVHPEMWQEKITNPCAWANADGFSAGKVVRALPRIVKKEVQRRLDR